MGEKPALQPNAAIGPAIRAIGGHILAEASRTLADPELSQAGSRARFRRSMKEWRALMRLLDPFIPDALRSAAGGARPCPLALRMPATAPQPSTPSRD